MSSSIHKHLQYCSQEEWDRALETGDWVSFPPSVLAKAHENGVRFPPVLLSKLNEENAYHLLDHGYVLDVDIPLGRSYYVNKQLYYHLVAKEPIIKSIDDSVILDDIMNCASFDRYGYRIYGMLLGAPVCPDTEISDFTDENSHGMLLKAGLWWGYEIGNNKEQATLPLLLTLVRETQEFIQLVDMFTPEGLQHILPFLTDEEKDVMWLQTMLSFGVQWKAESIDAPIRIWIGPLLEFFDEEEWAEKSEDKTFASIISLYYQEMKAQYKPHTEIEVHL